MILKKSSEEMSKLKTETGFEGLNPEISAVAKRNYHLKELELTRCEIDVWPNRSVIEKTKTWSFDDIVVDLEKAKTHMPWDLCDKHLIKGITKISGKRDYLKTDRFKKSSIRHWGQRKMLMTEITLFEFLIDNLNDLSTDDDGRYPIIYIGSAKGTHLKILDMMYFGLFSWNCIDPNQFDPKLVDYSKKYDTKFKFQNIFFTENVARKLADEGSAGSIFISDIRRGKSSDKDVELDLKLQLLGLNIMNPAISFLKFKFPYIGTDELYYPYDCFIHQIWDPHTSTETRIVITDRNKEKLIKNSLYEKSMFGFNLSERRMEYQQCTNSYCKCFDCWSEEGLIKQYLGKKANATAEDGTSYVEMMKNFISESLRTEGTVVKSPEFYNYDQKKYTEEKLIEWMS